VVCIGQAAIGVGRALRKVLNDIPMCTNGYDMQFLFVDDYGLEDSNPDPADIFHRCERCAYTWEEGYKNGYSGVVDKINQLLENCDNPGSFFIIYGAAESLGSGLCSFLSEYVANNLPGLTLVNIGLLPHVSCGGLDALNIVMSSYASGLYANSRLLRRLDDSDYILQSIGMHESVSAGLECAYSCVAADTAALMLDPSRCTAISFPSRILDVRSSLWSPVMQTLQSSLSASKKPAASKRDVDRAGSGAEGSAIDRCFRLMTMNLHSLHLSSRPPLPSPRAGTEANTTATIDDARVIAIAPSELSPGQAAASHAAPAYTHTALLQQRYCDVVAVWEGAGGGDRQRQGGSAHGGGLLPSGARVMAMIQSSTPGVAWPTHIPQHTICDHRVPYQGGGGGSEGVISGGCGRNSDVSVAVMCFASAYAKHILKEDALPRAQKCRAVGAFASSRSSTVFSLTCLRAAYIFSLFALKPLSMLSNTDHGFVCSCRDEDFDLAMAELNDWLLD
jgi:hypothetical protein